MSTIPVDQNGDCSHVPAERLLLSDNIDCGETIFDQIPSDFYEVGHVFGEPGILPRIGDEYQVQLPPFNEQPNHMSYSEMGHHSLQNFTIGLPIPLTWISCLEHDVPETNVDSKHPDIKNSAETEPSHYSKMTKEDSLKFPDEEKIQKLYGKGYILVPGLDTEIWSDVEKASFLLALYIFEKNFFEVRRFIETKNMGAILSYYYGNFYGSDEYRRWSEGQKSRSKKCVYGQRIFSGVRQQELLSRLNPKVSEKCKSELQEVSKLFGVEKVSLEDYISSMKGLVGMTALVEAVGIGTGKQDLTGMALEPQRSSQTIPARPEIPAGKACSSLTSDEIVKFLSDYRLSKARSNDLFWEAVWPRLLARGWHSEQPQNQGYLAASKNNLVFLMPGVKKFSRRKLMKGEHYFDSVTDVLSKVAKEPGLIELENEEGGVDEKKEDRLVTERNLEDEENDQPTRQRHCYLQPRTPNRSMPAMKFTIVDTSLSNGNIRELRSLPSQLSSLFVPLNCPGDSDESDSSDSVARTPDVCVMEAPAAKTDKRRSSVPLKNKKDLNHENKKPRKAPKPLLGRKQKQGTGDNIAPMSKRCRRLTANGNEEMRDGAPTLENGISCCSSGVQESNENLSAQVSLSSTSSSKGSPSETVDNQATEPSAENPPAQLQIDLNLPHVSLESESHGPADDQSMKQGNQSLPGPTVVEARTQEQAVVNPRRLSTRYRPPTTRALEAVANGYLDVNRRRKYRDSHDGQPSRPSQRPRSGVGPTGSSSSSVASPQAEEGERGTSSSGTQNIPDKSSRNQPDGNGESETRQ